MAEIEDFGLIQGMCTIIRLVAAVVVAAVVDTRTVVPVKLVFPSAASVENVLMEAEVVVAAVAYTCTMVPVKQAGAPQRGVGGERPHGGGGPVPGIPPLGEGGGTIGTCGCTLCFVSACELHWNLNVFVSACELHWNHKSKSALDQVRDTS